MLFEPAHTRLAGAWDIHKAQRWLLGALASDRLNLSGLVTHTNVPEQLGDAYEGLLKKKDEYLGVLVRWA
jgi:threonine dehydrogenase-like Zn-dependent dehydrogenase